LVDRFLFGPFFGNLAKILLSLSVFFTLCAGAPVTHSAADLLARHELGGGLSDATRRLDVNRSMHGPQFLMAEIAPGYNCHGYLWIGPARVDAVFDTGSTRNSVDKEFLKALLHNKKTQSCVQDVQTVKPLICRSVDKANPIVV